MRRFVTYLYVYKNGQKQKNTGHIRVDRNERRLHLQINMKDTELNNEKGIFYLILKDTELEWVAISEITMLGGGFRGRIIHDIQKEEVDRYCLENIMGVGICFENGAYMASCWNDRADELIARGIEVDDMLERDNNESDISIEVREEKKALEEISLVECENRLEADVVYRKINLNEIYSLSSEYWHFSNNSFLLHGFWNYGFLLIKESYVQNETKFALGIPGVFEKPEMVMATYFGFPTFEKLPLQIEEKEMGEKCSEGNKNTNQQLQDGTFGGWFVNL